MRDWYIIWKGEKAPKYLDRDRLIQPIAGKLAGFGFDLGYIDHSRLTVEKDIEGNILSEEPTWHCIQSGSSLISITGIYRGFKILEAIPEIRGYTLFAADNMGKGIGNYGLDYDWSWVNRKKYTEAISNILETLGKERVDQILTLVPEDLEEIMEKLTRDGIRFDE